MKQDNYEIMDLKQACEFLKMKESRVRTGISRKEIPHLKIDRMIRFNKFALIEWLKSCEVKNEI